jgi:Probable molybdopterin binding domain
LFRRPSRKNWQSWCVGSIETAASTVGVRWTSAPVNEVTEIERTITAFAREPNGGLICPSDSFTSVHRKTIIPLAARHRLPAMSEQGIFGDITGNFFKEQEFLVRIGNSNFDPISGSRCGWGWTAKDPFRIFNRRAVIRHPLCAPQVIMIIANSPAPKEVVTAALLVIGGKILSGRTKDQNIGYIAEYLTALGIDVKEVRVVGDKERAIVDALNALRHRCTYVFTTGGIGPTHNDITAACVAKAFGVPIDTDPRTLAILYE